METTIEIEVGEVTHTCDKDDKKTTWVRLRTSEGKIVIIKKARWIPRKMERLSVTGKVIKSQYGEQFEARAVLPVVPENPKALLDYAAKLTPGFGPRLTERIWEALGENWMEELDELKPGEIKNLSEDRIKALKDQVEDIRLNDCRFKTISWLMSVGTTQKNAESAWDLWEKETVGVIQDDCFRLTEVKGIGFAKVDNTIRHGFGIADEDPRRLKAGVKYALAETLDKDKSTLCRWPSFLDNILKALRCSRDLAAQTVGQMLQEKEIVGLKDIASFATCRDYDNEKLLWEFAEKCLS